MSRGPEYAQLRDPHNFMYGVRVRSDASPAERRAMLVRLMETVGDRAGHFMYALEYDVVRECYMDIYGMRGTFADGAVAR